MTLGIVGSEEIKFTPKGKEGALLSIRDLIHEHRPTLIVSGACHLGGIDIWAIEIAKMVGIPVKEYIPHTLAWEGYKARNILIAQSDLVVCITVDKYPPDYTGMRFKWCYHCKSKSHVKSGGCWTMHKAISMGNKGELIVVDND